MIMIIIIIYCYQQECNNSCSINSLNTFHHGTFGFVHPEPWNIWFYTSRTVECLIYMSRTVERFVSYIQNCGTFCFTRPERQKIRFCRMIGPEPWNVWFYTSRTVEHLVSYIQNCGTLGFIYVENRGTFANRTRCVLLSSPLKPFIFWVSVVVFWPLFWSFVPGVPRGTGGNTFPKAQTL